MLRSSLTAAATRQFSSGSNVSALLKKLYTAQGVDVDQHDAGSHSSETTYEVPHSNGSQKALFGDDMSFGALYDPPQPDTNGKTGFSSSEYAYEMPEVEEELPVVELVDLPRSTIEDLPDECKAEDITASLVAATGVNAHSIEFFHDQVKRRVRLNAFIVFENAEDKARAVTPTRLDFGLHVRGVRCNFFDTDRRQNRLFVHGLPHHSTADEAEGLIYSMLYGLSNISVNVPQTAGGRHRGFALVKGQDHMVCREAMERMKGRSLEPGSALGVSWAHAPTRKVKVNGESQFDDFLHRLKERMLVQEQQLKGANALLEQQGYVIDAKGKIGRRETQTVAPEAIVSHALNSIPLAQMPSLAELRLQYIHCVVGASGDMKQAAKVIGVSPATIKKSLKELADKLPPLKPSTSASTNTGDDNFGQNHFPSNTNK